MHIPCDTDFFKFKNASWGCVCTLQLKEGYHAAMQHTAAVLGFREVLFRLMSIENLALFAPVLVHNLKRLRNFWHHS